MKIPASRRKTVSLKLGIKNGIIAITAGSSPSLWVGERKPEFRCLGVVRDVKKLRDMCNEILDRRELESLKK